LIKLASTAAIRAYFLPPLFDVRAVALQDHHPGFDHLIEIAMLQGIRQSVAGNSPTQDFLSFL
jgi:hypothetical protein